MKQVDVLLRTNGDGLYLAEAMQSILRQTRLDQVLCHVSIYEPTERLLKIIDQYSKNPFFCFHTITEAGYAHPLNEMIKCAKGAFIAILDHDDLMMDSRIEIQLEFLKLHPEIGAIGSAIYLIDNASRVVGEKHYQTDPNKVSSEILRNTPIANPSCMIRKQLIEQVGGYRSFYDTAEDYDLWLRLSEITTLTNLPEKLTSYRIHNDQITARARFLNLAASKSAIYSKKCRIAGIEEIHVSWESASKWASQPHIKLMIKYQILHELALKRTINYWKHGRILLAIASILFTGLLRPIFMFRLARTKLMRS